jgi:hypothetical protein
MSWYSGELRSAVDPYSGMYPELLEMDEAAEWCPPDV